MRTRRRTKQCTICGHVFGDRETVSQHMTSKHPEPNQFTVVGKCGECGKCYKLRREQEDGDDDVPQVLECTD